MRTDPNPISLSRRRSSGESLVELMVSCVIVMFITMGTLMLFGSLQGMSLHSIQATEVAAIEQGRMETLLADLARGDTSALLAAIPTDFATHYVAASGSAAAPWTVSAAPVSEDCGVPSLSQYRLETSVRYVDDPWDGVGTDDDDTLDAIEINLRIAPIAAGAYDAFASICIQTRWYR